MIQSQYVIVTIPNTIPFIAESLSYFHLVWASRTRTLTGTRTSTSRGAGIPDPIPHPGSGPRSRDPDSIHARPNTSLKAWIVLSVYMFRFLIIILSVHHCLHRLIPLPSPFQSIFAQVIRLLYHMRHHLLLVGVVLVGVYLNMTRVMTSLEKSVFMQAITYFGRPHEGIPTGPIDSPANWKAKELLTRRDEWVYELQANEISELQRAVSHVKSIKISLDKLTKSDFPLPILSSQIQKWRRLLDPKGGLGVVVIKGVPVGSWTIEESSVFWWGLGLYLGRPGAQNGRGDLLGHVKLQELQSRDESPGESKQFNKVRQYMTNEKIEFHCDAADVVGLLCLKTASSGGKSRLASSVAVYNELLKTMPHLIKNLFEPLPLDTRGDGGLNYLFVTPCQYFDNVLRTFWHTEYFRSAYRYEDSVSTEVPERVEELISAYDSIANDPEFAIEMEFEEGDVQLISNHVVCLCDVNKCKVILKQ